MGWTVDKVILTCNQYRIFFTACLLCQLFYVENYYPVIEIHLLTT